MVTHRVQPWRSPFPVRTLQVKQESSRKFLLHTPGDTTHRFAIGCNVLGLLRPTSRLGSPFPTAEGAQEPGTLCWADQLPEGLTRREFCVSTKKTGAEHCTPCTLQCSTELHTALGFRLQRGKRGEEGNVSSPLGLSDSRSAVCCAVPWKAQFCGYRQNGGNRVGCCLPSDTRERLK